MRRVAATGFVFVLGLLFMQAPAPGGVPPFVSFHGRLSDAVGDPVVDGDYSVAFRIYDVETGGAALWEETQTVSVADGLCSVLLGTAAALDLPFDAQYWLAVEVESDAEMTPRFRLTSAPYALRAKGADQLGAHDGDYYLDWNNLTSVPAGFADGQDDTAPGDLQAVCEKGRTVTLSVDVDGAIHAENTAAFGRGIYGEASLDGVYGVGTGISGCGVYGTGPYSGVWGTSETFGVLAGCTGTSGSAVLGTSLAATGSADGVYGQTDSPFLGSGVRGEAPTYGVRGHATGAGTDRYGVYGHCDSPEGYGVYSAGKMHAKGDITCEGSASFAGGLAVGSALQVGGPITTSTASVTADYALTSDDSVVFADASTGPIIITLPAASPETVGRVYFIYKVDSTANAVNLAASGGDTVYKTTIAVNQWEVLRVIGFTSDSWISKAF